MSLLSFGKKLATKGVKAASGLARKAVAGQVSRLAKKAGSALGGETRQAGNYFAGQIANGGGGRMMGM